MERVVIGPKTTQLEIKLADKAIVLTKNEIDMILNGGVEIVPGSPVLVTGYPPLTKLQNLYSKFWFPIFAGWMILYWTYLYKFMSQPWTIAVGGLSIIIFMFANFYNDKLNHRSPIIPKLS
jgi:hypothetical protein